LNVTTSYRTGVFTSSTNHLVPVGNSAKEYSYCAILAKRTVVCTYVRTSSRRKE
jgi:hypothetical protein